jgi:two-component system, NtrC family, response regulator AtoC
VKTAHTPRFRAVYPENREASETVWRRGTDLNPRNPLRTLITYDYPGNVRELRNIVERAAVLARGPLITVEDLPSLARNPESDDSYLTELMELPLEQAVANLQRRMIRRALDRAKWNKAEAARALGINRQLLYSKLKELGIE